MGEYVEWSEYLVKTKIHKAIRAQETFMLETPNGWMQGRVGEWIVEMQGNGRFIITDEEFRKAYVAL